MLCGKPILALRDSRVLWPSYVKVSNALQNNIDALVKIQGSKSADRQQQNVDLKANAATFGEIQFILKLSPYQLELNHKEELANYESMVKKERLSRYAAVGFAAIAASLYLTTSLGFYPTLLHDLYPVFGAISAASAAGSVLYSVRSYTSREMYYLSALIHHAKMNDGKAEFFFAQYVKSKFGVNLQNL